MNEGKVPPGDGGQGESTEPIPIMQRILDNPFILLFLGVTVPAVIYTVWGVMEVVSVPLAN